MLQEVARTLINNAIEALAPRQPGTIWVRAEPYHQPGSRVILRIVDDGPGVPEQLRNELFKPFISAKRGREHLGLGLFLAASLLDIYNGTLRYETRPDGGAVFVLEIPPARFTLDQPYHWSAKGVAS